MSEYYHRIEEANLIFSASEWAMRGRPMSKDEAQTLIDAGHYSHWDERMTLIIDEKKRDGKPKRERII